MATRKIRSATEGWKQMRRIDADAALTHQASNGHLRRSKPESHSLPNSEN